MKEYDDPLHCSSGIILRHNLYSGGKHRHLFSQRSFTLEFVAMFFGPLFLVSKQTKHKILLKMGDFANFSGVVYIISPKKLSSYFQKLPRLTFSK